MQTGERLRLARRRLRMTQRDLAGDDFHRSLISQIETGLIEPSLQTLTILADRVGLPASFFIQSDGEIERTETAIKRANTLVDQGNLEEAHQELLNALPLVSSYDLKSRLLLYLGEISLSARRPGEALGFLEIAQRYLRCNEDAVGLVEALLQTGRAKSSIGKHREAIDAYTEALWLLDRFVHPENREERQHVLTQRTRLSLNVARSFIRLEDYEEALRWLNETIFLATEAGLYEDLGLAHQSIALIHKISARFDEAEQHDRIALRCFDQPEHAMNRAICLSNMGDTCVASNRPLDAVQFYTDALNEANGDARLLAVVYAGLATAYYDANDCEKAIEWAEKAMPMLLERSPDSIRSDTTHDLTKIFVLLARMYEEKSQQGKAWEVLENGLQWFTQNKRNTS